MNVQFKDNRLEIKKILNQKALIFLKEASDSIISQTQRNTPVGYGNLKRSFSDDSYIDENELTAYIGSSLEHSIWVEMGTGEYAEKGNGRKGGWWIPVGSGKGKISLSIVKKYGWKKVIKDKSGNPTFVFTYGMKPKRMLYKAYQTKKNKIQDQANKIYEEMNNL